jgi:hypothetical protein
MTPAPAAPPVISPAPIARRFKKRYVFIAAVLVLFCLSARAVTGYFFLGSASSALRNTVKARAGGCEKKFAVRLGWITTGLIRYGSSFVHLPPEPRLIIDTLHRLEVGVYKLPSGGEDIQRAQILTDTDAAMTKRGWDRIVGVVHQEQVVAIYAPHRGLSGSNIECAVLVLNGRDMVVAAGQANPAPLLELAFKKKLVFRS